MYLKGYIRPYFNARRGENVAAWTLEQARRHLEAWMEAEIAVTTGQKYQIGTRELWRADLGQIREQIKFWGNEVSKLENANKRKGTNRIYRAVPRDL